MKKKSTIVIVLLSGICVLLAVLLIKSKITSVTGNIRSESYISGVLYQESAEIAAQYKQAFELAKIRLDQAIEENGGTGNNLYIVTDIDATLMDDSPYIAGVLLSKEQRKKEGFAAWNNGDWKGYYAAIATEAVQPVEGAQEFISYARAKGVKLFFITNRPYYELDLTVNQLKRFDFIDEETYLSYSGLDELQEYHNYDDEDALKAFRDKVQEDGRFELEGEYFSRKDDYTIQVEGTDFSGDKAARRHNVERVIGEEGKVVLYLGDSINDMISAGEYEYTDYTESESSDFVRERGNKARKDAVMSETWADKWGTQFIVMPNAAYGDWLKATWYEQGLSDEGEIEAIRQQLNDNSYLNYKIWYTGKSPVGNEIE